MEVKESPFFVEFVDSVLGGGGFNSYLYQRESILNEKEPEGHFLRLLKFSGKVAVIEYYLSLKVDTLFVLSGHLVKAGDKRDKEKRFLKQYISEIKKLEEDQ
jgi:hypothetical protein